eukprot:scaffold517983_cov71-Attheya_sp.AAC.1
MENKKKYLNPSCLDNSRNDTHYVCQSMKCWQLRPRSSNPWKIPYFKVCACWVNAHVSIPMLLYATAHHLCLRGSQFLPIKHISSRDGPHGVMELA